MVEEDPGPGFEAPTVTLDRVRDTLLQGVGDQLDVTVFVVQGSFRGDAAGVDTECRCLCHCFRRRHVFLYFRAFIERFKRLMSKHTGTMSYFQIVAKGAQEICLWSDSGDAVHDLSLIHISEPTRPY